MAEGGVTGRSRWRRLWVWVGSGLAGVLVVGLLLPERMLIPVTGASANDWNPRSFWFEPWGRSGVHKGVDIFGRKGTPVVGATGGLVLYAGELAMGGTVVAVLGPKWRVHYYAHLQSRSVATGDWVWRGEAVGTLGDSGNAVGKAPHLHYSILSLIPIPWLATTQTQGWKRMFYLDPVAKLSELR